MVWHMPYVKTTGKRLVLLGWGLCNALPLSTCPCVDPRTYWRGLLVYRNKFPTKSKRAPRMCQNHWEMSEKDGISQLVQICSGSSFPEIVPASVAVTWHLLLRPAIWTPFAPSCSRSSLMRALAWHLLDPTSQAYRSLCASLNLQRVGLPEFSDVCIR